LTVTQWSLADMADTPPEKFKRAKSRRLASPAKRIVVSEEARRAYEDTIRQRAEREQEHGRFLPDDLKGKR
jgi:hypothetical protein